MEFPPATTSTDALRLHPDLLGTVERLPTPIPYHHPQLHPPHRTPPLSRSTSPLPDENVAPLATPTATRSKTLSFFSSGFKKLAPPEIHVPPPRTTPSPPTIVSGEESGGSEHNYYHNGNYNGSNGNEVFNGGGRPEVPGSATSSLFFGPPSLNRPTPPPSVRSTRSSTSHDEHVVTDDLQERKDSLPPLHRFFPSRHSRPSSTSSREFVELDVGHQHLEDSAFAKEWDTSPVSSPTSSNFNHQHHSSVSEEHGAIDSPLSPPTPPPKDIPLPSSIPDPIGLKEGVVLTLPTPPTSTSGSSTSVYTVTLVRSLGQGTFSSVWLAKDGGGKLVRSKSKLIKKDAGQRRRSSRATAGVLGLRPGGEWPREEPFVEEEGEVHDWTAPLPQLGDGVGRHVSIVLRGERDGPGASDISPATPANSCPTEDAEGLIALKLIPMSQQVKSKEMSRISIAHLREISILSRISHPSIISFLGSFESGGYYVLALPYIAGGELFELLNVDQNYFAMTEPVVRRIWTELVRAVGWCHGIALVHRDVKLENILLTQNPFQPNAVLPPISTPLIKLTDFNLSRFIDPLHPLLTTKCGSESYAAPEIILGRPYDGRETDSWACGVALYAMVCRDLPFAPSKFKAMGPGERRREELMNIARGAYTFPSSENALLLTPSMKKVIERLLMRDPNKRSTMLGIWEEEWMSGEGAVGVPVGAKVRDVKN